MSFYNTFEHYKNFDFNNCFAGITDNQVQAAIQKEVLSHNDILALLSPCAEKQLEQMAQISQKITFQNFGKAIVLYTPIYISDYCDNHCAYCSFNRTNKITRKKLSFEEIEKEAISIASTGLRHILVLTGDSRKYSPVSYICEAIKILKKYFPAISLEIYALEEAEYAEIIEAGADGLTIYQETYDEELYEKLHPAGPKRNYIYRMDAPERACKAWMRSVNVGALLGLSDWRKEVFFTLLHAQYLQDKYTDTEISVSFPRMRPHTGKFDVSFPVSDKHLVQMILATRIFLKRAGITISTRENSKFRDNLMGLGVTRMSIGSNTAVGGHTTGNEYGQFQIADNRNIETFKQVILDKGFEPVLKDWQNITKL
ncbi:MAG: 2-iminoacetate synthase ThiH [Bacteroidetes bacterium]|nr:2-iminoacetate synthase ThiH [Bacteroidota bacterium]